MMGRGKAACSSRNPPPHLGLFPFPRPPVPNQHLALCPIPSAHTPLGISATLVVQRTALDTDQCLRQPPPPKTPDRSSKHLHLDVHRHLGLGRFKTEFLIYHLNVLHLKLSPSQLTAISFFSLLRPKTLGQSLAPLPSASHTPSVRQPCGLSSPYVRNPTPSHLCHQHLASCPLDVGNHLLIDLQMSPLSP